MNDIILTDEQYKSLPYKGTSVPRAKTYGEIIGLLESHDIHDYQYLKVKGQEILSFPIIVKRRDVEQGFVVKLSVPKLFYPVKKGRSKYAESTLTYLENESWRIFWWHLKSKLEAIEYGISTELKEFMYDITYSLTNEHGEKQDVSIGETMFDNIQRLPELVYIKHERMLEGKEVLGEE